MLTRMSDSPNSDPRSPSSDPRARAPAGGSAPDDAGASAEGPGVLGGLPRTRPQRASARRAASRATSQRASAPRAPRARKPPGRKLAMHKPSARQPAARGPDPVKASAATRAARQRVASTRPHSTRRLASTVRATAEPAPRQGYEAEPDLLGGPVQPPGAAELVASAAELAGELAKTGVTTGTRLLKDILSRLPG